jgi:hypothetical protein
MRDRGIIIGGLALFLALVTFPVWYNLAAGTTSRAPKLTRPVGEKNCVAPPATMRTSHMDLLMSWRDQVVRQHVRSVTAFDGRTYTASLTHTCLKCHTNKAEFCDRCHTYAGVAPSCWTCHIELKQAPARIIHEEAVNNPG